ncbi:pyridoxamine 5'-phosphate oxidase family protein [Clostridia bacterium OttesenSCG-928-O13]|nr:pyridoxamine 5'-phosphate oxidase family protein [Clostridia bacterium OttesenSCG-928-O13]
MEQNHPMRRKDRALSQEDTMELLAKGEWGMLATADAEGAPLATPLSYVMLEDVVYFHCAKQGHKMDNLAAQKNVCFCVVGETQPVYDGNPTTYYESVMVHGTAFAVEDEGEKRRILLALCEKYLPQHMEQSAQAMEKSIGVTAVVGIRPRQVTGKGKRKMPG